ncbi:MAG TPA: GNAT family N-acetyltransferase [Stellaceae bacterium]|nr:GNAT family N-acetyltransferase [Stellaceae bacterium]
MLSVRPATIADVQSVARVDVETWQATYAGVLPDHLLVGLSERQRALVWSRFISRRPGDTVVAVEGAAGEPGRVLAFGSCGPQRDQDLAFAGEVFTLYVDVDYQGRGMGRQVLLALFARLVRSGLYSAAIWVLADNPARFFYERVGGKPVARRRLTMGRSEVEAIAYGWPDLAAVIQSRGRAKSRID